MANIDSNTLFYLRGDSLESLCPTSFTTTIASVSIIDKQESGFVKALDFNGGTSSYVVSNLGDLFKGDWTVELFYDLDSTVKKSVIGFYYSNTDRMFADYKDGTIGISYSTSEYVVSYALKNHPTKFHMAFSCKNNIMKIFIDGEEVRSVTNPLTNKNYDLYLGRPYPNNSWTIDGSIYGVKVSNVARYTENFIPSTTPDNNINIDLKIEEQISFSVSKSSQEVINKVEVLVNDEVVEIYNEIGDLSYNIDKNIMDLGNNDIKIRVTYDNIYTEEIQTTYCKREIIDKLYDNKLDKIIQKQEEINNAMIKRRNYLLKILNNKGLTLNENIGFLDLINAVDQITNNNSEEISNYISQISNLNSTIANNKQNLITALRNNGEELTGEESFEELINMVELKDGVIIKLKNIKQIDGGSDFITILTNDGNLWVCGDNAYGQLGLGDTTNRYIFTQASNNVKQIACGANHIFILKTDGSVWSCGRNEMGQLGLNNTTNRTTFNQVTTNVNNDIKQIVCCNNCTFIIKNDDSVWSCGDNNFGQLGLGDTTNKTTFTKVTTNINNDVEQIFCGAYSTYVLKNDGSLWACGLNAQGQLGLGDIATRTKFTQVATNINNDVKQISACGFYEDSTGAYGHTLMIKNDGSLWGTGHNGYGQLGLGDTTRRTTFTQVTTNISDVKQIACYGSNSMILKNDGSIWSCGRNDYGQLGLGDTTRRTTFTQVTTNVNNDIKEIVCSRSLYHYCVIKNDGTIWACGYNGSGQFGLGDTTNRSTLVQIFRQFSIDTL